MLWIGMIAITVSLLCGFGLIGYGVLKNRKENWLLGLILLLIGLALFVGLRLIYF